MFRQPDPEMARWAANNFGETFIDEIREGTSYGANTIRDGVSINRVETRKQVVSYSEIMSLSNLYAYVRLPGQFPITMVDFVYKKRKRRNVGFLCREDFDENSMKHVNALLDKYEKPRVENQSIVNSSTEKKSEKAEQDIPVTQEYGFDL
jgi:type IV secretory pathway TraG/TraD family ATPase VirD4